MAFLVIVKLCLTDKFRLVFEFEKLNFIFELLEYLIYLEKKKKKNELC